MELYFVFYLCYSSFLVTWVSELLRYLVIVLTPASNQTDRP